VKENNTIQGVLSATRQLRSIREPTQYQSRGTSRSTGTFATYSGSLGHTTPSGHDGTKPKRNAERLQMTANFYGHGHTWKRAVVFHIVWPSKNQGRLRIACRCQRPIPPRSAASPNCGTGKSIENRIPRAILRGSLTIGHHIGAAGAKSPNSEKSSS
jgi:hypothetical protein